MGVGRARTRPAARLCRQHRRGTAIGFLLFASYANRAAVCDALSPVWLSDALLGGALLALIVWKSPARWTTRLALAAAAGVAVAAFHALAWPNCLSRLEGVSPEVRSPVAEQRARSQADHAA